MQGRKNVLVEDDHRAAERELRGEKKKRGGAGRGQSDCSEKREICRLTQRGTVEPVRGFRARKSAGLARAVAYLHDSVGWF